MTEAERIKWVSNFSDVREQVAAKMAFMIKLVKETREADGG